MNVFVDEDPEKIESADEKTNDIILNEKKDRYNKTSQILDQIMDKIGYDLETYLTILSAFFICLSP